MSKINFTTIFFYIKLQIFLKIFTIFALSAYNSYINKNVKQYEIIMGNKNAQLLIETEIEIAERN